MTVMTNVFRKTAVSTILGLLALAGAAAWSPDARADKVHLKDGSIVEGEIVRQGDGFVYVKVRIGALEKEQLVTTDQIARIEKTGDAAPKMDEPNAKPEAKPESKPVANPEAEPAMKPETAPESMAPTTGSGTATRVAILNFGPPSSWQGTTDSTVGIEISAKAWEDAIPMLEADKTDVVVVRINSGGGLLLEIGKFHKLFEEKYKKKFRTVGWVESAISAAAMSPYVLEEFYFMPEGNLGACTGWSGQLVAVKDLGLSQVLLEMEEASAKGKRDFRIMRSMQIQEPLSATIDPQTGEVQWFQDLTGENVLNPKGQILTLTAHQAVKFGFAKGIAASKDDLARAMGIQEVEWVGKKATDFIDNNMREGDKVNKQFGVSMQKYRQAFQDAGSVTDRTQRGAAVNRAKQQLSELKRMIGVNPNFGLLNGVNDAWFREQEDELRRLLK